MAENAAGSTVTQHKKRKRESSMDVQVGTRRHSSGVVDLTEGDEGVNIDLSNLSTQENKSSSSTHLKIGQSTTDHNW